MDGPDASPYSSFIIHRFSAIIHIAAIHKLMARGGAPPGPSSSRPKGAGMDKESLTITDNRTGKQYEVPISDGTIRAMDLRKIKVADDDFGLMTYDPAFMNTASCKSRITFIDGDLGILRYRGYSIDQLAERSNFL